MRKFGVRRAAIAGVVALAAAAAPGVAFGVQEQPSSTAAGGDAFYTYDGSKPLSSYMPGDVLKVRTLPYHVLGIVTPLQATQLLYRTTDEQGHPSAGVTSVLRSPGGDGHRVVSYQSFYDSLDPEDGPSRAVAGNVKLPGGLIANGESTLVASLLLSGYEVVLPDTEGQAAHLTASREYGYNTLDSLRAASSAASRTGISPDARFGLMGYSGGAVATNWAASLAPQYAPDINKRLVGYAEGGLLVKPSHILRYIQGSQVWSGLIPELLIGQARSYDLDLEKYLNDYGKQLVDELQHSSIADALGHYPGLTWKQMAKPEYANPDSVPELVEAVNKTNLGLAPTPTVPGYIGQGNAGFLEGTTGNIAGIGSGDGVAVAGDTRALARKYCAEGGAAVWYQQYDALSHLTAPMATVPTALAWLRARFAGEEAPSSCGSIAEGNSLAADETVPAG
ncbi:Triacylglycerol lipase [Kitasatospora sp. MMS16-BH015]|uniref:lipase family protein n=1 Tax=Kitasatospora sp. MMS16-BH015 TaxID=2018025 RepID=UPI000CA307D8|nr:lipase family protein [Kitasatospora sp. MMS16-BH015]AUG77879.1 Triacylglycerol lipase [Kitasatospora sp. MMS16-BH015]